VCEEARWLLKVHGQSPACYLLLCVAAACFAWAGGREGEGVQAAKTTIEECVFSTFWILLCLFLTAYLFPMIEKSATRGNAWLK